MKHNIIILILCFVTGIGFSQQKFNISSLVADDIITYKTIDTTKLHLHVFYPEGHSPKAKKPVIIFFFGGGWTKGTPEQFYAHCKHLSSKGMVAITVEYRVKTRNNTSPIECVYDGASAVSWVKENATQLGIDPNKVVLGGGSAGGHIAAAIGTQAPICKEQKTALSTLPNALVLFNPVFDNGPEGYGYSRVKEYWQDISPLHNIKKSTPPTIVFLGDKDHLIPVATAKKYKEKMESYGNRCELFVYEGQTHGFFNYRKIKGGKINPYYDKTIAETTRFLTSLGYL